jgi:hypothetical protein
MGDVGRWYVRSVTPAGRRAVGQWPTPENVVTRLSGGVQRGGGSGTRPRAARQTPCDRQFPCGHRQRVRRRGRGKDHHPPNGHRLSQHSTSRTQVRILGIVGNPVPDARQAGPGIGWKEHRIAPPATPLWVRIGGEWRRGRIIEWVRQLDRDGWDCVIMADVPVSGPPGKGATPLTPKHPLPRHGPAAGGYPSA